MGFRRLKQSVQEGKVQCEGFLGTVKEWVAQAKEGGEIIQVCLASFTGYSSRNRKMALQLRIGAKVQMTGEVAVRRCHHHSLPWILEMIPAMPET